MINQYKFTIQVYDSYPYLYKLDSLIIEIKDNLILLDETIFYPAGGGQPGDTGRFILPNGDVYRVIDTFRDKQQFNQIWLKLNQSLEKTWQGKIINTYIDWERRYRHMQMHTCLHLLSSLIDAPVTGCSISEDKARLDFDLPNPTINKETITNHINQLINKKLKVTTKLITQNELNRDSKLVEMLSTVLPTNNNAIRLVEVENTDIQPCSGTHVTCTNEIQRVICTKIKKISRLNRRIEIGWDN